MLNSIIKLALQYHKEVHMRKTRCPSTLDGDGNQSGTVPWPFTAACLLLVAMCLTGCAWDSGSRPSSSGGTSSGCGPGCSH